MLDEIGHLKTKAEHPKSIKNDHMLDLLKKELKIHQNEL